MRRGVVFCCALSSACMAEGIPLGPLPGEASVIHSLQFSRQITRGVSEGFDLDALATNRRQEDGCYHDDFRNSEGERGIDNNMAHLLPLIDLVAQAAVELLVQNAVNEGRLLVIIERVPLRDGGTVLQFRRGDDVPLIGSDGLLLADQTLSLHEQPLLGVSSPVVQIGNVVEAAGFDLRLPVVIFSTLYVLDLYDARIRFELRPDGSLAKGLLGGGVWTEQLLDVIRTADGQVDPSRSVENAVGPSLRGLADLAVVDGDCTRISTTVQFDAVRAFVF